MTDITDYHRHWAERLNMFIGSAHTFFYTPEFVAEVERLAGKPIGEMSTEDWDSALALNQAEVITVQAEADQVSEDGATVIAAMQKYGARFVRDLAEKVQPGNRDYEPLRDALRRLATAVTANER